MPSCAKSPTFSAVTLLSLALWFCAVSIHLSAQNSAASQAPASAATAESAGSSNPQGNSGAGQAASNTAGNEDKRPSPSGSLKLGPGDLVEMSVYNIPELTTKTRISTNGEMYCPLIGYMHVAGLTAEEAQASIEKRLSEFVKNPHVSLFVSEYASQGASVLGEVMRPGVYPVLGQQHLFDLLSAAGGLSDKAGRSLSITHRSDPNNTITITIPRNLDDNSETNVAVFPGDTVIVRKADIVYVVGDVQRPSAVLMDAGGLTVLQALAMAGGTGRTAKLSGAKLLRKEPTGTVDTPIDLKKMLQAKLPDLPLQANDILIVPSSAGRIMAGRTLEAAIQAATLVSVAAVP